MKYMPTKNQMEESNDNVQTPPELAKAIVEHYLRYIRHSSCLEPCAGSGNIFRQLPVGSEFCDIDCGIDFFEYSGFVDWIITNPPWSKFRAFLNMSMRVASNVVFLIPLNKMLGLKSTFSDIKKQKFGIAEIKLWDTPRDKAWPQSGFQIGTVWLKYEHRGKTIINTNGAWRQHGSKERDGAEVT